MIATLRVAASRLRESHPEITRLGYFGSLTDGARYGFGSDADVVVVVSESEQTFIDRARGYELAPMPVPVDLLVYTEEEIKRLLLRGGLMAQALESAVWL